MIIGSPVLRLKKLGSTVRRRTTGNRNDPPLEDRSIADCFNKIYKLNRVIIEKEKELQNIDKKIKISEKEYKE